MALIMNLMLFNHNCVNTQTEREREGREGDTHTQGERKKEREGVIHYPVMSVTSPNISTPTFHSFYLISFNSFNHIKHVLIAI